MSNDKKPLSIKMFLHKSGGKVSASAFLQAHREFLLTGELAKITAPILSRIDAKQTMPTEGLDLIRQAVLNHHLQVVSKQVEAKLLEPLVPAIPKNWTVSIYNSKGDLCTRVNENGKTVDLEQDFALAQEAAGWADRRLVNDGSPTDFAVIIHNASAHEEVILRNDALARFLKAKRGPVIKVTGKGDNRLSFGTHVKPSRSVFSHG